MRKKRVENHNQTKDDGEDAHDQAAERFLAVAPFKDLSRPYQKRGRPLEIGQPKAGEQLRSLLTWVASYYCSKSSGYNDTRM